MPHIVMIGPPGAGKGTQSERLCQAYRIPKISTGDILRDAVHRNTPLGDDIPLGDQVRETIGRGGLVPDALIIEVVRQRLAKADAARGFILDGFPRTVVQAEALDGMMADGGRGPIIPVVMVVHEDELVRRLGMRRVCEDCGATYGAPGSETAADATGHCRKCHGDLVQRDDDNVDVIVHRLRVFTESTAPLVEFYRERPTFAEIDGLQPPDRVTAALRAHIAAAAEPRGEGRA